MKIKFGGRTAKRTRFFTVFVISLLLLFTVFITILTRFKPVFAEKASHAANKMAINIINESTANIFSDISSLDLVIIDKDTNGNITSINANTIEMNRLKANLSKCIQENAENTETSTVHIPIGSLTKFEVLQGFGYRIPIKISTDGVAKIDFDDEFVSCGINQVKHKIFMTVSVRVSVISAAYTKTETVTTQVPVAETIISGTVPTYFGDKMSVLGR